MRRSNRQRWQRLAWIASGLVLIGIVLGIYFVSLAPLRQVRKEAIAIAEKRAALTNVSDFYWDRQRESYLTVVGRIDKAPVYVLIRQKTGQVQVIEQKKGITAAQAIAKVNASFKPAKVFTAGLSQRNKKFVWDIGYKTKSGKLGYVTYDFKTGDQLTAIENL